MGIINDFILGTVYKHLEYKLLKVIILFASGYIWNEISYLA